MGELQTVCQLHLSSQHGWVRAVQRQRIRGAAVADGEVRGGLLQRKGGQGWARGLLPLLQHPKAPPGPGLLDTGVGVQLMGSTLSAKRIYAIHVSN